MNFYQKYIALCNARNISPSKAAIELGASKPAVSRWKNGSTPSDATVQKVAAYFGVTVDALLSSNENTIAESQGLSADIDVNRKVTQYQAAPEQKEKPTPEGELSPLHRELIEEVKTMSMDDVKLLLDFVKRVKNNG